MITNNRLPIIYEDRVTCSCCKHTFVHRANVINRGVIQQKDWWNNKVQDHLIDCAINRAEKLNSEVCKFLNFLGIDAKLKED